MSAPKQKTDGAGTGTRVLVVADDAALRTVADLTLTGDGLGVIHASDGGSGFRTWSRERPDVVILDAALPDVSGNELASRIRATEASANGSGKPLGHTPILILAPDTATSHRVAALRVGADDVLAKPFESAELAARIRALLARFGARKTAAAHRPGRRGRLIVCYGAKGGVGTTTIAINVAIALHRGVGRSVALVDGNLQFGDHRIVLDFGSEKHSLADMLDASSVDAELVEKVLIEHDSGVRVLLAPTTASTVSRIGPDFMAQVITELLALSDYVVVDIDQRLDEVNLRILDLADRILVVTTSDIMALKNVGQILEALEHFGYPADKVQLVLNRSNAMTGVTATAAERALRRHIDFELPNEYAGAINALNAGAPVMLSHPSSRLGKGFLALAMTLEPAEDEAVARQPIGVVGSGA